MCIMEHRWEPSRNTRAHTNTQWLNVTSGWCDARRYQRLNAITPAQAGAEGPGRPETT